MVQIPGRDKSGPELTPGVEQHLVNRVAVGAELGGQGIQRNIVEHDRGENLTLARSEHTKIEDRLDAKEILTVGRYGSL